MSDARDAEMALLGAAMSGASLDDLLDTIEPDDFYQPFHGDVWAAIARVHHAGNQPDPVTVRLALGDSGVNHDPMRLFDLAQACPVIAQAPHYAAEVAAASGKRRIGRAGQELTQLAQRAGDLEQIREEARQAVDDATRSRVVTRARTLADVLPEVIDVAENGQASVLPTGWADVDRSIGGLAPGRLVLIAARPGGGKSIAGTNLALEVAHRHGHAALIASLEMPELEVSQRLIAAHARVNLTNLANGTVDEASWQRLAEKRDEVSSLPITIVDNPGLSTQAIRKAARDIQRQRDDLALIVVDYLQLVRPPRTSREGNRAQEVTEISRELKMLARETGACVVALAQVNREGGKADNGPRLTDLREGGVENDADVVILLHRPTPDLPDVTATVAKNRHGPMGVSTLHLQGHYARLTSAAWSPTQALA